MVAGSPVWVQSPARNRLGHPVLAAGRLASYAGVAAKVARFSLTICQAGLGAVISSALATSAQMRVASVSRLSSTSASAPDTVTEMRSGNVKIHSAVPPITPSIAGLPAGAG